MQFDFFVVFCWRRVGGECADCYFVQMGMQVSLSENFPGKGYASIVGPL